jgi:hypothetical protein
MRTPALALALTALSACATFAPDPAPLAVARAADDFDTYDIRRVGVPPFRVGLSGGSIGDAEVSVALQRAFQLELAQLGRFEVVQLDAADVAEVRPSEPHRRGWIPPRAVLDVCERFQLDGLWIGTVTEADPYAPQALALQVELVARETGLSVWWSSVQLDAADPRLRESLASFERNRGVAPGAGELTLLSPARLARFAAYEVARSL